MSRTPSQRVDEALAQLVERFLPTIDGEDDAAADQRYYDALDRAKDIIGNSDATALVRDENHVADRIKRDLIRTHDSPDQALQFSNLFARLLSRPVLNQKWAILHVLHNLSSSRASRSSSPPKPQNPLATSLRGNIQPSPTTRDPKSNERRAFDEAFSRPGLADIPSPRDRVRNASSPRKPIQEQPPPPPRRRERKTANGDVPVSAIDGQPWMQYEPSEASILRDVPFMLQGISTTNFTFTSANTLQMPDTLPPPLMAMLHTLAEPSLLYRSLAQFQESSEGGLIGQALRAALGDEIRSYLSLVATLEGQIRRALALLEKSDSASSRESVNLGKAGVTLKRCVVWLREPTMALRFMSLIVEESRKHKGGQLISMIHSFASTHGDAFVSTLSERFLLHVTRPFYDMLRSWIYDGELLDPYFEFFVSEQSPSTDGNNMGLHRNAATSVWEDKYVLETAMIPSIITEEFAQKVFLIGKSLNFIRYGCGDATWVEEHSKSTSQELKYGDTAALESSVDAAYKTTMERLIYLMNAKFKLQVHLNALKKYLLLGQGDFIALLLESLASNLDRPANSQYRHTLTAQLEHSIRNSNAQYEDGDVLRRLDARMLELTNADIGWDVFTLDYKVDAPVDVVVTPWATKQYLKAFNFLWRIKRVEYSLGVTWRRCTTGARDVLAEASGLTSYSSGTGRPKSKAGALENPLAREWKTTRCTLSEMLHFTVLLQDYILFSVIETSWSTLQATLSKPDITLDDLITAHQKYLHSITRKGLLSSSASHGYNFPSQLHELLKCMLAFKDAVEGLYAHCVREASKREARDARIEARTRRGQWGVTDRDDAENAADGTMTPTTAHYARHLPHSADRDASSPLGPPLLAIDGQSNATGAGTNLSADTDPLSMLCARLTHLASDYRARVCGLLGDLSHQPDQDLRFLAVVMNFNDTYKVVRRSQRRREAAGGGPQAATTTTATTTTSSTKAAEATNLAAASAAGLSQQATNNTAPQTANPETERSLSGRRQHPPSIPAVAVEKQANAKPQGSQMRSESRGTKRTASQRERDRDRIPVRGREKAEGRSAAAAGATAAAGNTGVD